MMSVGHLYIGVIGDEELVNAMRLAGVSRYYMIKDDGEAGENARKALTELLAELDVGIVVMLEGYAQCVEDIVAQARKRKTMTPVIVQVPSKSGTRYPDIREYYRTRIRESIGFDIEL